MGEEEGIAEDLKGRGLEGVGTAPVICKIPINEIIQLPPCGTLKHANCQAQSVLVHTPECESEVAQPHSTSKGQNQVCTGRWGPVGASAPFPAFEGGS